MRHGYSGELALRVVMIVLHVHINVIELDEER
jgi:hypothetical protein